MRLAMARFYPYRRPAGRQNPYARNARFFHRRDCGYFVAHQANGFCFRANEDKAGALNLLGKVGVLGEEAVADGLLLRR